MPISAKQLNLYDISTDFDKFYNQSQDSFSTTYLRYTLMLLSY